MPDLSVEMKSLLMLIKTYCFKGTNYLIFKTRRELAELLHISKNNIKGYLEELTSKGYIKIINNTLHLSLDYFQLSVQKDCQNDLYETIYKYCLDQDVTPPYKDVDSNHLGTIAAAYCTPELLLKVLKKRCPKLPQKVSMNYFTQVLRNMKVGSRKSDYKEPIQLILG